MRLLTVVLMLTCTMAFGFPPGELTFFTRDGRALRGRILAETPQGYLVAGPRRTELLPFTNIGDMRAAEGDAVSSPQPLALALGPPGLVPVVAPEGRSGAASPPQAAVRADDSLPGNDRLGFHIGLGGGLMVVPLRTGLVTANAQINLDWTFGVIGVRLSPTLGLYQYIGTYVVASADTKVHFNITEAFSMGVGVDVGASLGLAGGLFAGLSAAPVIIKLGSRGPHQIALQVSLPFLLVGGSGSTFGGPMGSLGYNYLF
jgi:hypothetical protein